MKKVLLIVMVCFFGLGLFSQEEIARYQTMKSVMKISAFKDGENFQWENKNISAVLDYRTGEFTVRLRNSDFRENKTEATILPDSIQQELEYMFKGMFPIREIINQKSMHQSYVVELQLTNWELYIDNTINFDLTVTNPGTNQANYRMFQLHGKMYNYELNLPAFNDFDNVIEIWISFNARSIQR